MPLLQKKQQNKTNQLSRFNSLENIEQETILTFVNIFFIGYEN